MASGVDDPPAVVETLTGTVPVPAGTMTRERGGVGHVDRGARGGPKSTVVEPETKPVPVTVTVLVPAGGPLFGLTPVTVGAAL